MRRRVTVLVIAGFMALIGAGAASQEDSGGGETVATVGESRITEQDLRDELVEERKSGDSLRVLESLTPEGRERMLKKLIEQRLLAAEARKRGLNEDPEVRRAISRAVDEVLAGYLVDFELRHLDLSDPALFKYYRANTDAFTTPGRVKVRHIVVTTEAEAEEALKEVKGGKDFALVASERNIDASRKKGGELGWVSRGVMVKPFEEALFSLSVDEVSGIVKTNFGFHIIKAEEVEAPRVRPFDVVKQEVRRRMVDEHIRELKREIEKQIPVQINEDVLKAWNE